MTIKFGIGRSGVLLVWMSLAIFLTITAQAVDVVTEAGQVLNSTSSDCAYCVSMEYLCTSIPGTNGGRPVCQFPNGGSCDAHAFFTGNCSSPSASLNPYAFYSDAQGALDIADATKTCNTHGGAVEMVHTPYGDANVCVFPNGESIDLPALNYAVASGENAAWYWNAYSFLNAP